MSRSGYSEDCDYLSLWRRTVENAIRGKRGQAFLREMAAAMDSMPEKKLIADQLIDADGNTCAMGAVLKARGLNIDEIDYSDPFEVGRAAGIARALVAEIAYINDEEVGWRTVETPEQRWGRVRRWIENNLAKSSA